MITGNLEAYISDNFTQFVRDHLVSKELDLPTVCRMHGNEVMHLNFGFMLD